MTGRSRRGPRTQPQSEAHQIDIFISYRRAESQYLVKLIREALVGMLPAARVFVDTAAISAGDDFAHTIEAQLRRCGTLLAVIGPAWQVDRLHQPNDMVRRELLLARESRARIVPILHGDAKMPGLDLLPVELTWLADRNAVRFGDATQLESDVSRLVATLTHRAPEVASRRAQAWAAYEQGDLGRLRSTVESLWESDAERPSPAAADAYRALGLALYESGRSSERNVWWARAVAAAHLSGSRNALAACLLPFFFTSIADGEPALAREVLKEIARLMDPDDDGSPPTGGTMRRLYHEKLAYAFSEEGLLDEAMRSYQTAIRVADGDLRGQVKARAAYGLCLAKLGRTAEAIAITEQVVQVSERRGWRGIGSAAVRNLEAIRDGRAPVAYEVI